MVNMSLLARPIQISSGAWTVFVEVDELNEGFLGGALFSEPVDGLGADDVSGESWLGTFIFSIANPARFVADLGVVVGAEPVIEAVVIHAWNIVNLGF